MKTRKTKINKLAGAKRCLLAGAFLLLAEAVSAQTEKELKGRVVDPDGKPIPGAMINIVEETRLVLSDENGFFILKGVKATDELCVNSIGYFSATVAAEFSDDFEIVMEPDDDLYVHTTPVPFGQKTKRFTTESMSVVSGEELERYPVTVLQNAFTSTVTGMETYEWASEPGWSETSMYIRGIRTMNSGARAPLVIVDNVERDLSFLDAYPIENITILKDAAACAIYGMRGANGAIIVTTKRGQSGKTNIDFTQEVGFQTLTGKMETQNAYNTALTRNQVRYLDGNDPMYSDYDIEMYRRVSNGEQLTGMDQYKYFNTNWFDQLYREAAPQYRTNLTLSGGNERARYFVSFSYLRQEGMWNDKWTEYNENFSTQHILNRYNLRSNIDIDVNKYLNVSLDLGGRIDNINQPLTSVNGLVTFGAVEGSPMEPVFTPNGEFYGSATAQNAARMLSSSGTDKNRRRNVYTTVNVTGNLESLLPGLKANAMVSFDSYETFQSQQSYSLNSYNYNYQATGLVSPEQFTYSQYSKYQALTNPSAVARDYYYNINFNAGLQYSHTFAKKHAVDARAFIRTYQHVTAGSTSSERYLSYNAQATYVYDNRYILSGNISRMGSDNFAPGERFGTFPGGSVGWVLSEESWLKNPKIDLLKLRASYGRAGQAVTGGGRYPWQSTYAQGGGYPFGTTQSVLGSVYESMAGNTNNKWEISDMLNIGVDFDFWDQKLYGSVDLFKEWRSNILVSRSTIPLMFGLNAPKDSYGKAESKGLEITLGHKNKVGDFSYYVEGMLTCNTNKITEMDELEPNVPWQRKTGNRIFDYTAVSALYEGSFNNTVGGWNQYQFVQWASDPDLVATSEQDAVDHPEKYPYNTFAGGTQKLGTAVFKDLNGDRKIDDNDMIPAGYTIIPEITPSLNLGFAWKGFDVRAVLTAYLNRSVFLSPAISYSGWSNLATHEVTKAWGYYTDDPTDPRNVNAAYPRPTYGSFSPVDSDRATGTYHNAIWIKNGNYLSLRNIEVGYSLPQKLIAKAGMTKCRIYFIGYNLCNWSGLPDDVDPEKPMSYCWWYPKTKSFSFGVNVAF